MALVASSPLLTLHDIKTESDSDDDEYLTSKPEKIQIKTESSSSCDEPLPYNNFKSSRKRKKKCVQRKAMNRDELNQKNTISNYRSSKSDVDDGYCSYKQKPHHKKKHNNYSTISEKINMNEIRTESSDSDDYQSQNFQQNSSKIKKIIDYSQYKTESDSDDSLTTESDSDDSPTTNFQNPPTNISKTSRKPSSTVIINKQASTPEISIKRSSTVKNKQAAVPKISIKRSSTVANKKETSVPQIRKKPSSTVIINKQAAVPEISTKPSSSAVKTNKLSTVLQKNLNDTNQLSLSSSILSGELIPSSSKPVYEKKKSSNSKSNWLLKRIFKDYKKTLKDTKSDKFQDKLCDILSPPEYITFICCICLEQYKKIDKFIQCSNVFDKQSNPKKKKHVLCLNCLKQFVNPAHVNLDPQGRGIKCPIPECDSIILVSEIQNFIDEKVKNQLIDRIANISLSNIPNLYKCKSCQYSVIIEDDFPSFTCLNCGYQNCKNCEQEYNAEHKGKTCQELVEYQKSVKKFNDKAKKIDEIIVHQCHRCGLQFVKESGCNMMTCNCGAKQCYLCRATDITYAHFASGKPCSSDADSQAHENQKINEI